MALNQFADFSEEEFSRLQAKSFPSEDIATNQSKPLTYDSSKVNLPSYKDWQNEGYVSSVKNQGNCGSCWAFAATATIESMHAIQNYGLLDLSEEQLMECTTYFNERVLTISTKQYNRLIDISNNI